MFWVGRVEGGKGGHIEEMVSLFAQITSDLAWFRIRPKRGTWILIRGQVCADLIQYTS